MAGEFKMIDSLDVDQCDHEGSEQDSNTGKRVQDEATTSRSTDTYENIEKDQSRDGEGKLCVHEGFEQDLDTEKMTEDEPITSYSTDTYENIENIKSCNSEKNLFLKFSSIIRHTFCFPEHPQQTAHFSDLPYELVLYILRFVVNNVQTFDLKDFRMLGHCAAVCRGWYLCTRDPVIYRQVCFKLWSEKLNLDEYGGSWRQMLIERRPTYTFGCYVSVIENSPSDFRYYYLKLFSNDYFIFISSADCPTIMISRLQEYENAPEGAVKGRYQYWNHYMFLSFFERPAWDELNLFDAALRLVNYITFSVTNHETKRNCQLNCVKLRLTFPNNVTANIFTQRVPPFKYFS